MQIGADELMKAAEQSTQSVEPYVSHYSTLTAENVHLSAVNLRLTTENERLLARIAELEQEYWDLFRDSGWR